jgi:hypothetical protein
VIRGRCRWLAVALCAAAGAGCGVGPGAESEGEATLTVTRDFGSEELVSASVEDPPETETVIRLLDREAEITTRYGGGFVQSIEGLGGTVEGGRSLDWFFYVDGIESPVGSAEREVRGGHRIWWDYRDWTDAMRVPAVVGSWPEPFAQAAAEDPVPVAIECHGERPPCETVAERLEGEGVEATISDAAPRTALRLLVGPWAQLRADEAAAQLDRGPATSGVFARFADSGSGPGLVALDPAAEPAATADPQAGLVAALRLGERPATWLVTGAEPDAVERAAAALDTETLANRYAIAVKGEETAALPALVKR